MGSTDDKALATIGVTVLYFARLREAFGVASERVELPADTSNAGALREQLRTRGGVWAAELAPSRAIRVAVNQEVVELTSALRDGDEVALFPPVTGG